MAGRSRRFRSRRRRRRPTTPIYRTEEAARLRHCEERSDEAIQFLRRFWIASLALAMTENHSLAAALSRVRPPDQKPALDQRHHEVNEDHEGRQHEHAGENTGDVEDAFG